MSQQPATHVSTPEKHVVGDAPPPPVGPRADVEAGAAVVVADKKKGCGKLKAWVLGFRAAALGFSFLSFILVVIIQNFTILSSLSYIFAISLIVLIYTTVFVGIHGHEVRTGEVVIPPKVAIWMNFLGDQILALFLLSAGSAGGDLVTLVNQLALAVASDSTIAQATASVAMTFLAFFSLEAAALISTFNFSLYISKACHS